MDDKISGKVKKTPKPKDNNDLQQDVFEVEGVSVSTVNLLSAAVKLVTQGKIILSAYFVCACAYNKGRAVI